MKILWLHNHYQVWGGESAAAEREARLLAAQPGVTVVQEAAHNDAIRDMGFFEKLALPLRNAWSLSAHRRVRALCRQHRPDVVHAHNVWPLLSPAVFAAARREGVATVFTAHNFYLFCLNGVFFRDGAICTDCKGSLPWSGIAHRCYRGVVGSSTRFVGTALHRALSTFHRIDRILVPTSFARQQFLDAGFAADRVQTKWLSCEDPGEPAAAALAQRADGGPPVFLVACRLVEEKGVHVLLEACRHARAPWRLQIAGEGPERGRLETMARGLGGRVSLLGQLTPADLQTHMAAATAVLLPSIWYETFGLTAIEAFAAGRPVIASSIGALQEVVDETSGLRVAAGDAEAFAAAMDLLAQDPALTASLGRGARARYLQHFTPAQDAARLLATYAAVRRRS
jgi:glycosyltransferase involved in cell wall biosynthesis